MAAVKLMFLASLLCLQGFTRGDLQHVHCSIKKICILPCEFEPGRDLLIYWTEKTTGERVLRYGEGRYDPTNQAPRFKNRSSLFEDQLSNGNASLRLTEVNITDAGSYQCYVSATQRREVNTMRNLLVDAPPHKVNIQQVGDTVTCSSDMIYPEPELSWSSNPPSNLTYQDTPVLSNDKSLYSISSSLRSNASNLDYICIVTNRRIQRTATLLRPDSIPVSNTKITIHGCQNITETQEMKITWRFNHTEIILDQNEVTKEWKKYVGDSPPCSLVLKDLTVALEGVYTCEVNTDKETFVRNFLLKDIKDDSHSTAAVVGGVVGGILILILLIVGIYYIYSKSQEGGNRGNVTYTAAQTQ